jgi:hypothetical protein
MVGARSENEKPTTSAAFSINTLSAHFLEVALNKQHFSHSTTTTMNTTTMDLQNNNMNMNEDLASPRSTKETLSFSLHLCNAPIRRKPSFEYDFHQVQEPSLNLLLPVLDVGDYDDEQDGGPYPTLRPRREPLPYDHFYLGTTVGMPESPMRIPPSDEDDYTDAITSSEEDTVSVDSSSFYCPMPMALDDDSLSLSDSESLEGLPFAPSLAHHHGFEEDSLSNENVVCQLTRRFNQRRPTPAIVLQPRSRTSTNAQTPLVFRGQDLEFPSL